MKPNSILVYNYVKENGSKNITAADIAEGTGLNVRTVNGIVTAAFQRHTIVVDGEKVAQPLMVREPAEIELADNTHQMVKFIKLTEAGESFNPEASDDAE
jgi:hypothetical protein